MVHLGSNSTNALRTCFPRSITNSKRIPFYRNCLDIEREASQVLKFISMLSVTVTDKGYDPPKM